jgi:protein O-mannosyl-transferase
MGYSLPPSDGQVQADFRAPAIVACALIVIATTAAYYASFDGPFVLDDVQSVVENPTIRRVWPLWPVLASKHSTTVIGRPLLSLSLAVNYSLNQTDVAGYHLFNLAIHVAAALVLFGLVRRTLLLPTIHQPCHAAALGLALASALIWAVHPLSSAAVLYIVQRAESMAGLFYIVTLYCVLRGATSAGRQRSWYAAAVSCCLGGMATKEVMATAPIVVLLYDRVFLSGSFRHAWRVRRGLHIGLASTWIPLAILIVFAEGRSGTVGIAGSVNPRDYALTQFAAVTTYLRLSIWPDRLVFDYGEFLVPGAAGIVPCALLIGAMLAGTAWLWTKSRAVAFPLCCFWILLTPTSSIVPIITQTVAEHRMYLPLAAIVTLTVTAAFTTWNRLLASAVPGIEDHRWRLACPMIVVALVAGGLAFRTWSRSQDYRSAVSLWRDTVDKRPENARARNNFGVALVQAGNPAAGLVELTCAVTLKPDYADAWFNHGYTSAISKDYRRAITDYTRAIELQPRSARYYSSRGVAHGLVEDYEAAVRDLNRALELDPKDAEAYENRAIANLHLGRYRQSLADLERFKQLGGEPGPGVEEQIARLARAPP